MLDRKTQIHRLPNVMVEVRSAYQQHLEAIFGATAAGAQDARADPVNAGAAAAANPGQRRALGVGGSVAAGLADNRSIPTGTGLFGFQSSAAEQGRDVARRADRGHQAVFCHDRIKRDRRSDYFHVGFG